MGGEADIAGVARGLSEAQRNAIFWLDGEWFEPWDRDMQRVMWTVDAVLLRPAVVEHRELLPEGEPPAHQFRLTPLGLSISDFLKDSPQ